MTSTALLRNERSSLELVAEDDGRATRCNRRIIVPRYGGPDVMMVIEEPIPEPGPGEVRVRILVAGVGYPDVLIREGTYPGGPKPHRPRKRRRATSRPWRCGSDLSPFHGMPPPVKTHVSGIRCYLCLSKDTFRETGTRAVSRASVPSLRSGPLGSSPARGAILFSTSYRRSIATTRVRIFR